MYVLKVPYNVAQCVKGAYRPLVLLPRCYAGEMLARSKKNPRRVGANFHDSLRRAGLLDKDDETWCVTCFKVKPQQAYMTACCTCAITGFLLLGVCGITDQDHTQSQFPPKMLDVHTCLVG